MTNSKELHRPIKNSVHRIEGEWWAFVKHRDLTGHKIELRETAEDGMGALKAVLYKLRLNGVAGRKFYVNGNMLI